MSETTERDTTVGIENTLGGNWGSVMAAGAILAVLGLLAILFPLFTGISLSVLLGALLVVGGLVHVAHAFQARGWKGFLGGVLLALLYLFAGASLIVNPVVGLATLTLLLIAYFLVDGVVELVMAWRLRPESNWAWVLVSGVVSLVLAGLIWVGWPSSAAWAVGLLFGVNLLTTGVALILVALGGRSATESEVAAPTA